jgi:hypothetical protein
VRCEEHVPINTIFAKLFSSTGATAASMGAADIAALAGRHWMLLNATRIGYTARQIT